MNASSDELVSFNLKTNTLYPFPRPLNLGFDREVETPFRAFPIVNKYDRTFVYALPTKKYVQNQTTQLEHLHWVQLDRGEHETELTKLPNVQGIRELLRHCYVPETTTERFHALARMLRNNTNVYELKYREIDDAKDLLLDLTTS